MSFSNVAVGSNAVPASQFDFSKDITTTFDFGECQPTNVKLLVSRGKSKISTEQIIRLAPLVSPAFGRLRFHQYHQFVPMSDIFPSFGDFLANTARINEPTNPLLGKFSKIPNIPSNLLMVALLHKKCGRMKNQAALRSTTATAEDNAAVWTPKSDAYSDRALQSMIPHVSTMFDTTAIIDTEIQNASMFCRPDEADFVAYLPKGYKYNSAQAALGSDRIWVHKHSRRSLRLYKIFLACGMKPTFKHEFDYSALPLLAFFKAYWDIMRLPQYDNIQNTAFWRLIKFYEINGSVSIDLATYSQLSKNCLDLWFQFFEELCECFYTSNADFVSAHEPVTKVTIPSYADQYGDLDGTEWKSNDSSFENLNAPKYDLGIVHPAGGFSHLDIDFLMKAYYWCNQKSQIGYNLRELIKAKGYETKLQGFKKTCYIGSTSDPITVDEVLSTAEGQNTEVGDYAGVASCKGGSKAFKYYNNEAGYIVSFACILPDPSTTMQIDPAVLGIGNGADAGVYPFYSPILDGLGKVSSPKAVAGYESLVEYSCDKGKTGTHFDSSYTEDKDEFGTCPPFMGNKVGYNIRNGLMAINSQRDTFAPWTMDRMSLEGKIHIDETTFGAYDPTGFYTDNIGTTLAHRGQIPLAGAHWRKIFSYPGLCNYKRIFYDGGDLQSGTSYAGSSLWYKTADDEYPADDFMCLMRYTQISTQSMLPVSRTWDTIDDEQEKTGKGTFNAKK